jgi:septal ring factor EnvC (AmiA/AmiB activator)
MFSSLSSPLLKVLFVSNLVFLASTGLFAYYSYSLKGDLAVAERDLSNCANANLSLQISLKQQELSCKADDVAIVELTSEKKELQDKMDDLKERLDKLSKSKPLYLPSPTPTQKENISNETNVIPNSALLSPELVGLLREAYCSVEPDDNRCTTR